MHDGTYRSRQVLSSFGGGAPRGTPKSEILGLNFGRLTANISKTVSRSVTSIRASNQLDEGFLKSKSRGSSCSRESIINKKYVDFMAFLHRRL